MPEKFPGWRYHPYEPPLIVASAAEAASLGPGWYESTADFPDEKKRIRLQESKRAAIDALRKKNAP